MLESLSIYSTEDLVKELTHRFDATIVAATSLQEDANGDASMALFASGNTMLVFGLLGEAYHRLRHAADRLLNSAEGSPPDSLT